jgi:hypothetical protein
VPQLEPNENPILKGRPKFLLAFPQSPTESDDSFAGWNAPRERAIFELIVFGSGERFFYVSGKNEHFDKGTSEVRT